MLIIKTSKSVIKNLQPKLKRFQSELEDIKKENNNFIALTNFFNLISKYQDEKSFQKELSYLEKKNKKNYKKETVILRDICQEIEICSRNKYGMNRTEKGESVTFDNVFLGDVFGLRTHSISYWVKNEDAIKQEVITNIPGNPSVWEVIFEWQAGCFVKSNTRALLNHIKALLS